MGQEFLRRKIRLPDCCWSTIEFPSVRLPSSRQPSAMDELLLRGVDDGCFETVKTQLEAGADCNARYLGNGNGSTALHLAVYGHSRIVSALAKAGADKDALDDHGETPLMKATSEGSLDTLETLLAFGADVNIRRNVAQDPGLHSPSCYTALHIAAHHGYDAIASALLQKGADKDIRDSLGDAPIIKAAKRGHLAVLGTLLRAGADPDTSRCVGALDREEQQTPLIWGVYQGHLAMVKTLLRFGANPNIHGMQDKDALGSSGDSPLIIATRGGHLPVVKALLDAGADVSFRNTSHQDTALNWAAQEGHVRILELLLARGADLNSHDEGGSTAFHVAARCDQAVVIDALLDAGANIESRTATGAQAPLLEAASFVAQKAVLTLLRRGADVNARNGRGKTALHWVCRTRTEGAEATVDLLLRWGADETAEDENGWIPSDILDLDDDDDDDEELQLPPDGVERIRLLLERAPADRTWRRRSWLIMLRSLASTSGAADGDDGRGVDLNAAAAAAAAADRGIAIGENAAKTQGSGSEKRRAGAREQQRGSTGGGDLPLVVAALLGLELEGVFRTVVGFL